MKKFIGVFIGMLFMCLSFSEASAQLRFWNNTGKTVWVAISQQQNTGDYSGWVSEGWYKIAPGQTSTVVSNVTNQYYYYYAYNVDGTYWGGDYNNAIDPKNKFKIFNSDSQSVISNSHGRYEMKGFRELNMGSSTEYTFELIE